VRRLPHELEFLEKVNMRGGMFIGMRRRVIGHLCKNACHCDKMLHKNLLNLEINKKKYTYLSYLVELPRLRLLLGREKQLLSTVNSLLFS